jgi:hypothetical protein
LFVGTVVLLLVDFVVVIAGYWQATDDCVRQWGCGAPATEGVDDSLIAFGTSLLALLLVTLSVTLPRVGLRAVRQWLAAVAVAGQLVGMTAVAGATG